MATKEHTVNETNWSQFIALAKEKWHKLTDEDFNEVKGSLEQLGQRLQQVYGLTKERAVFEIENVVKKFSQSVLDMTEAANEKLVRASEMLKPKSEESTATETSQTKMTTAGLSAVLSNGSNPPSPSEVFAQSNQSDQSSQSDAPIFLNPNGGSMKKKAAKPHVAAETTRVTTRTKHPENRHH